MKQEMTYELIRQHFVNEIATLDLVAAPADSDTPSDMPIDNRSPEQILNSYRQTTATRLRAFADEVERGFRMEDY